MRGLSIGELARRTGVKVPTIRYYEEVGLLDAPDRSEGGQRRYNARSVGRLDFIRHARELGFDMPVIREMMALSLDPGQSCEAVDAIATEHLAAIDRRIAHLTSLRAEIARMVEGCAHGEVRECRILQVLGDHGQCAEDHVINRQG
ncbi:MerR family transcriptional regulator [Microvirga pudoricolor]|uniref:MerR family transcriptional regulator n=1 Tax=Microvirga pudoricolor TaxID=2778729 RepID=UPI0019523ADE|nr:helix-turn-helix domain-containing protein [Microvirga pudoricolor]MBM6593952.1 helix-turn-helix domain-containing protein [Microvirga pudoricolor]